MKGRLQDANIQVKTKTFSPSGGSTGGDDFTTMYHINVPKDKVHHAHEAMRG